MVKLSIMLLCLSGASLTPAQNARPNRPKNAKSPVRPVTPKQPVASPKTKSPKSPKQPRRRTLEVSVDQGEAMDLVGSFIDRLATRGTKNHGCWCAKMANDFGTGGDAIDELDDGCKNWYKARKCLTLPGGACENGVNFGTYTVRLVNNEFSDDMDVHCGPADDGCAKAICMVDYKHLSWIVNSGLANRGSGFDRDATCVPANGAQEEKMCEGTAPDVKIVSANICEDVAPTNQFCAYLISTHLPRNVYEQGAAAGHWPGDVAEITMGSGVIGEIGGYLSSMGMTSPGYDPVIDFYQRTKAIMVSPGCELQLFDKETCNGRKFGMEQCAPEMTWQTSVYQVCANLGPMNNQAVYYTCTCPNRSVGDRPNPWLNPEV